jgi:hypothetical protein
LFQVTGSFSFPEPNTLEVNHEQAPVRPEILFTDRTLLAARPRATDVTRSIVRCTCEDGLLVENDGETRRALDSGEAVPVDDWEQAWWETEIEQEEQEGDPMDMAVEPVVEESGPREGPGQAKLLEVWMDFRRGGRLYAWCDARLPEGLGEHCCRIVLGLLDATLARPTATQAGADPRA